MKIGNVLSVFDGMGCAKLALDRAGIEYDTYYASEIDSHAIKVTKAKGGNIVRLGSVTDVKATNLPPIDLLCGGSPCQGFSFAGKGLNFEDPRSKLFFEFVRLLKECREINPKVRFLLENVRMKKEHENVISDLLEIQPILFNSALVCAQNRERLYWTNIAMVQEGLFGHNRCSIPQPKDTGALLRDILQDNVDDKYYISEKALARMLRKAYSMPKVGGNGAGNNSDSELLVFGVLNDNGELRETGDKSTCIDANYFKGVDSHAQRTMIQTARGFNQGGEVGKDGKSTTLTGNSWEHNNHLVEKKCIRRLTPIECCRLQTVPDEREILIFDLCLEQVKNFVGVVNQNPKLQKFVLNALDQEQNTFVSSAIKNFFTNLPQKGSIVPQNVNTLPLLENQTIINTSQKEQSLIVDNVENIAMYKPQNQERDFVALNVFIDITSGNKITPGKGELPLNEKWSVNLKSGNWQLDKFGLEINHLVSDVGENTKSPNGHSMSTTLSHLSIKSIAQMSAILFYFAENAIDTFTQSATLPKNLSLRFSLSNNYFFNPDGSKIVSESQMYKMLGNGFTIDLIVHIFKQWK